MAMVRANLMEHQIKFAFWNVEHPPIFTLPSDISCLCHIGVLYHLPDPLKHLSSVLQHIVDFGIIDTHVCDSDRAHDVYSFAGRDYDVYKYNEKGRDDQLSGLSETSVWLQLSDLRQFLIDQGLDIVEERLREEKAGQRVCIYFSRRGTVIKS